MTTPPALKRSFDLPYVATLAAVFVTGFASAGLLVIKPLLVGALIDDYGFTPQQAGFVAGIEMAGIGIAAFIVAAFGGGWNRRMVVLAGTTIGILGSIAPMIIDHYWPILVARLFAGIGSGLIASVVLAVIGTTRDPDRTFGMYYMLTYAASAVMVPAGLWAITHYAVSGGYGLLVVVLAVVYVTALRIPTASLNTAHLPHSSPLPAFPLAVGTLILGVSLLFWLGMGGVWAFVERLGGAAGMSALEIGGALSAGPLASIAGALTASLLHVRFGRFAILMTAVILAATSVVLVGVVHQPLPFTLGVLLFSYVWPLFLAYLGGAMSAIDPSGRVIAMSVTSQTIGMAVGPALSGIIAGHFGYHGIAFLGLACFAAALPLLVLLRASIRTTLPVRHPAG